MITFAIICGAFAAGWSANNIAQWWGQDRGAHEPRAVKLRLPDPNAHTCTFARIPWGKGTVLACTTCRKPPPTLITGPGVSVSR